MTAPDVDIARRLALLRLPVKPLRPEATWVYPRTGELPLIYDCYALNVDGEDAVVCFLGMEVLQFPIVSVRDGTATDHGTSPVPGVHGLLVDGDRALLVGGYPPDFDVLTATSLGMGASGSDAVSRLIRPDGRELRQARRFCRGGTLYVFFDGTICATTTIDAPTTSGADPK